jgi:raffinose/stachyose/melibiose transport system permease protein
MKTAALNTILARTLIILLMVITLLPFLSMLSAALAPQGSYPNGLQWPADPQWGNFARAFEVAKMDQLLWSSTLIVLGVVPLAVLMANMAGYGLAKLTSNRFLPSECNISKSTSTMATEPQR